MKHMSHFQLLNEADLQPTDTIVIQRDGFKFNKPHRSTVSTIAMVGGFGVFQPLSANLTELSLIDPGEGGKTILAASSMDDVRQLLKALPYFATRAEIKALNVLKDTAAYLTESGREGVFIWKPTIPIATHQADTQEGIYLAPNPLAIGAWERETHQGIWFWRWFGITTQPLGGVDQSPFINAWMAIANIVKPWKVLTGPGFFPCHSRITTPTFQLHLEGCWSGTQQTIIAKESYTEAVTGRGLFSFVTHGFQLRNMQIIARSGSGGALLSIILNANGSTGDHLIEGVGFTGGNFIDYEAYLDGSLSMGGGGFGIRDMRIINCTFFNAAVRALFLKSVRAMWINTTHILSSGGTGPFVLEITGTTENISNIINISGGNINGPVTVEQIDIGLISIASQGTNVNNAATATRFTYRAGSYNGGILQHNWTNGSRYEIDRQYQDRAAGYLATTLSNVTGAGAVAPVIFDTMALGQLGWDPAFNYNTTNGRYTALYTGDHNFIVRITLAGLTSAHTRFIFTARQFLSGGAENFAGKRQMDGNPFAMATGAGEVTLIFPCRILLGTTDYVTHEIMVDDGAGGGSAVVDIKGSLSTERWSGFEMALAA